MLEIVLQCMVESRQKSLKFHMITVELNGPYWFLNVLIYNKLYLFWFTLILPAIVQPTMEGQLVFNLLQSYLSPPRHHSLTSELKEVPTTLLMAQIQYPIGSIKKFLKQSTVLFFFQT